LNDLVSKKDNQMNRSVFIALAVAAMAFSTSTASAGGSGSQTQYVRIKNIGSSTLRVVAANGTLSPASASSSRLLSQNAVTQFVLKKGAGQFAVGSTDFLGGNLLNYNFPNSTYVYLQAKGEGGVYTPSFAPPGTRF
jgi:hypothetical protein